jgi:hypothetical protein
MNTHDSVSDTHPAFSEPCAKQLAAVDAQEAADPRFTLKTKALGELWGVGPTRVSQILSSQRVPSRLEGSRRVVLKPFAYSYLRERIIASNPPKGAVKVRQPSSMFKRKARARTQAELDGLARANARRHEEAVARREARSQAEA